jgi:hypothetical protein
MKWLFEIFFIGGIVWYVASGAKQCNCQLPPEDYFIIETKETEMCVDKNRETIVTKITRQGKVEF